MKLTSSAVRSLLPVRDPAGHKGSFGRVYCLCGCEAMPGAAVLSVSAAVRSGAGLCTVGGSPALCRQVVSARPEVITHPFDPAAVPLPELAERINAGTAAVIGSGLGKANHALVRNLVPLLDIPLVIDADGIRALTEENFRWDSIHAPFVITPHLGEMQAVCGKAPREILQNRERCARETAEKIGGCVLLKGPGTLITDGSQVLANTTGSDALATAGSGDVLGGLIGGLAAQGVPLLSAAAAGAYLHGLAGDLAAEKLTNYCVIASDVLSFLPEAFKKILSL